MVTQQLSEELIEVSSVLVEDAQDLILEYEAAGLGIPDGVVALAIARHREDTYPGSGSVSLLAADRNALAQERAAAGNGAADADAEPQTSDPASDTSEPPTFDYHDRDWPSAAEAKADYQGRHAARGGDSTDSTTAYEASQRG
jgi:hypothetical protein